MQREVTKMIKNVFEEMETWPVVPFCDGVPTDDKLYICTLKRTYREDFNLLFKSIFESKLGAFILDVKYHLGDRGYSVDPGCIKEFPIPNIRDDHGMVKEIIENAKLLQSLDPSDGKYTEIKGTLDDLIFKLYGLVYYDAKEIEHYYIEKQNGDIPVTDKDIEEYCREFIDTLKFFVMEGYFLVAEWACSESLGIVVRFSGSQSEDPLQYNEDLENLEVLQKKINCEKEETPSEEKINFYDNDLLYIIKSNRKGNWTEFMAMKDANEELHAHFGDFPITIVFTLS